MLELFKRIMVKYRPLFGIMQTNYNDYAQLKKVNITNLIGPICFIPFPIFNWFGRPYYHYTLLLWGYIFNLYVLGSLINPLHFIMALEFFSIEDLL